MTLDESARRLGRLAWVEQRLFEVLGRWVRGTTDPDLAVALATASRHHGRHAHELEALLPRTRDHDPETLVAAPPGREEVWAEVARLDDPVAGLALLAPVRADQLAALEAWLADASPVRDGPGIRVLAPILARSRAGSPA